MNTEVGQILSGRYNYRIVEIIQSEVRSSLCLARRLKNGQLVIVKVLSDQAGQRLNPEFQRDMTLLNEAASPRVPHILDYGTNDRDFFVVLENVEGLSLWQILEDEGRKLEEPVALFYLKQLAEILIETGRHGLVHGGIRPSDILITPEGQIRLVGFGISRYLYMAGAKDPLMVTALAYTAPEQLQVGGAKIDIRADIYSLGAVGYEMLTGHAPFEGNCLNDLVRMIVMDTRPPASQFSPQISPGLSNLLSRCLAKDPADRYQTPNDLLLAIDSFHVPSFPERSVADRPEQRGPRAMLISATGLKYVLPAQGGTLGRTDPEHPAGIAIDLSREERGRTVSRRQAQLQRVRDQWIISPFPNTTNATMLNGRDLKAGSVYPLKRGDELQVGGVKLVLQFEDQITNGLPEHVNEASSESPKTLEIYYSRDNGPKPPAGDYSE